MSSWMNQKMEQAFRSWLGDIEYEKPMRHPGEYVELVIWNVNLVPGTEFGATH